MKLTKFSQQRSLGLFPVTESEINGLPMGVLSDGTPYLTMRGLARICGVEPSTITRLASNWSEEITKPRGKRINELMREQGFTGDKLYIITQGSQGEVHAYTDAVCMAFLEYYAFEAESKNKEIALANYRFLARSSFKIYIYQSCGYNPERKIDSSWQNYHDRLLLNDSIPVSHFSIFREMSAIIVNMIKGGCTLDDKTVPDISVGMAWSKYWVGGSLESRFGQRLKYPHEYPESFRQAAAGPQDAWIYPMTALGEFRVWLYEYYIAVKFGGYLSTKVSKGAISSDDAILLIESTQKNIGHIAE